MDFGTIFDKTSMVLSHDAENTINNRGSGFIKQERSDPDPHPPDDHQTCKSSRTDYFDQPNKTMSMRSDSLLSLSHADANNMLSFSSSNKDGNHTPFFSFYQPSPVYIKNTGYGYGGLATGMHLPPVSRYKGPFTPSQWMELEHQALIYKHFVANVPVPSQLLNPLRKSLHPFLFTGSSSSSTSYAPNSYGWGSFHLGFSGNTDPEPGRCRRTDGKKWRCSRDAVPDQKYCERHINRGRHRSRKPVEGHNGHAVSGPKVAPVVSSSSGPVSTARSSTTALTGAAFNRRDPAIAAPAQPPVSRSQEPQAIPLMKESSDSLMYPTNYTDYGASNPNPLPLFVDQWSKHESLKGDWTQLSMSIPIATSDFSSSSNSPAQEKLAVPPLNLTPELDLELDPTHKQASNWIPISWGNSMGGPLGEVLNRTSGGTVKNPSSEMWDAGPYNIGSSPTGVLQKTSFVSLSNSSSGSSPKGNKKDEHGGNGSLCDELLLSTLAS